MNGEHMHACKHVQVLQGVCPAGHQRGKAASRAPGDLCRGACSCLRPCMFLHERQGSGTFPNTAVASTRFPAGGLPLCNYGLRPGHGFLVHFLMSLYLQALLGGVLRFTRMPLFH